MSSVVTDPSPSPARTGAPPSSPPGAIILGGDYQGLGIVRSLGRRGIPTCIIDDEHSISRFSKYCRHSAHVAGLREERQILDAVLSTTRRLGLEGWVLYPTREELVAAISRHRAELQPLLRIPTPEWESVRWAWDKRNTYQLSQSLGIPTPATFYPQNPDQLDQLSRLNPPFALKPAVKENFIYATKVKAWRADSHGDLRALFDKATQLIEPGEIMIQEYIPGGGAQQYSYCAFFRNGEPVGKLVAQRRRQHPFEFGKSSTYVETVDIPILEDYSERFLRACNYYGLVELEYKLDPRDRQYKLLDVNARTWGYHSIGAAAGVDFSYMLYADQVGLPVTPCRGRPGVAWVRTTTDLSSSLVAILKGDLTLGSYWASIRKRPAEAVFSLDDPLPGFMEICMVPYIAMKRGF